MSSMFVMSSVADGLLLGRVLLYREELLSVRSAFKDVSSIKGAFSLLYVVAFMLPFEKLALELASVKTACPSMNCPLMLELFIETFESFAYMPVFISMSLDEMDKEELDKYMLYLEATYKFPPSSELGIKRGPWLM